MYQGERRNRDGEVTCLDCNFSESDGELDFELVENQNSERGRVGLVGGLISIISQVRERFGQRKDDDQQELMNFMKWHEKERKQYPPGYAVTVGSGKDRAMIFSRPTCMSKIVDGKVCMSSIQYLLVSRFGFYEIRFDSANRTDISMSVADDFMERRKNTMDTDVNDAFVNGMRRFDLQIRLADQSRNKRMKNMHSPHVLETDSQVEYWLSFKDNWKDEEFAKRGELWSCDKNLWGRLGNGHSPNSKIYRGAYATLAKLDSDRIDKMIDEVMKKIEETERKRNEGVESDAIIANYYLEGRTPKKRKRSRG